ncbi:pyridoxamine 5'-phosphate oxidase family protein [Echinimonas agarilytica]|uniref:Pyridoxamine 5'-phosphate oxidase family protein n=1 Tax=Echinimonas agarilytica TaxID=1215918 RepID=A0AA41W936_9GAMM|nr:pyridoxamine 5'-phosphate oxidase family protein [Echinimonas agarilytica]MCM2680868.1 pyridoxamine 5'-phosphate oxidase family protein [Echinimonas agarilytica]
MGQQFKRLSDSQISFIESQKLFFVGTATADSRVNVSPKGMDSFRVISNTKALWLNVTGSGNETSAHVQENPRMTVMFAAFEGKPLILRLYGAATVIHRGDSAWASAYAHFPETPGARQVFELDIELVQSSCGMSIPFYDYVGERELLKKWATHQGEEGVSEYWKQKNQTSIDGIATHIIKRSKAKVSPE